MDEKWAFLTPCWQKLRHHGVALVSVSLPAFARRKVRGFQLTIYDPRHQNAIPFIRDALELVLLFSRVDRTAFAQIALQSLRKRAPSRANVHVFGSDDSVPFVLQLVLHDNLRGYTVWADDDMVVKILSDLLVPIALENREAAFQEARACILDLVTNGRTREQAEMIRDACEALTISVDLDLCHEQVTSDMLQKLTHLEATVQDQLTSAVGGTSSSCVYGMGHLSVQKMDAKSFASKDLDVLESFVAQRMLTLRDRQLLCDSKWISPAVYGKALSSLIPRSASSSTTDGGGSFKATVAEKGMPFSQLCSSLMGSRDIQSLELDIKFTNGIQLGPHALLWLLHTLFSPAATHSIRHIALPLFVLSDEAVDSMVLYSQCSNPVALLFDQQVWGPMDVHQECQRKPKRVAVAPGTVLAVRPQHTRARDAVRLTSPFSSDVIHESDDGVHIIAPGYGQCRVLRSAVTEEVLVAPLTPPPTTCGRLNTHGIRSLTLNDNDDIDMYPQTIEPFIALVGRELVQISIEGFSGFDTAPTLDPILGNCPAIKHVRVNGSRFDDPQYFLHAYETGHCCASTLELPQCYSSEPGLMFALFQALGDPTTKVSATLRELSLHFSNHFSFHEHQESLCDAMTTALETNRTLRLLTLDVYERDLYKVLESLLSPFHGQWIDGCSDPMSNRSKWAFLSVVDAATRNNDTCTCDDQDTKLSMPLAPTAAMARLDTSVIALIQLAAEAVKREVVVKLVSRAR